MEIRRFSVLFYVLDEHACESQLESQHPSEKGDSVEKLLPMSRRSTDILWWLLSKSIKSIGIKWLTRI
jgi:hypothetical protein